MARVIRDYRVQVKTPQGELITIAPPFTMKANIKRDVLASINTASVTLINLDPTTRAKIYKDRYSAIETVEYWQMIIWSGYKTLMIIFQGNLYEAYSYKQGTEWYTQIEAYDGQHAIQKGYISETIQKNTSQKDVIEKIMNSFPETTKGAVGTIGDGENKRGKVLFGRSKDVLDIEADGKWFIDNETIYVLDRDEVISNEVILLDSELLKTTPKRRDKFLECDCIFFPEAKIAYICELRSKFSIYNGQYKIIGFEHNINISSAECGEASTKSILDTGGKTFEVKQ